MENPTTPAFLDWTKSFAAGATTVGGKGWNIGRLARYGFAVPPGGVLTAAACAAFAHHNGLDALIERASNQTTAENLDAPETIALLHTLRREIAHGVFPPSVIDELRRRLDTSKALAVRSSATCEDRRATSFAGIHDSFLNVRGFAQVLDAVRGCYASLWTPRAVAYRRRMSIPDSAAVMAVVIQDMAQACAAGVAFSCDPVTGDENVVVVDASFGLGDGLVAGHIEPDHYVLDMVSFLPRIRDKRLGAKAGTVIAKAGGGTAFQSQPGRAGNPALADADAVRLAVLVERVFEALGEGTQHQDVEWAFDGRDFTVLQARPVTVPAGRTYPELKGQAEVWSNANLRDAMPHVMSTLYWSSIRNMLDLFLCAPLRAAGYAPLPGAPRIRLFHGRPYFNLSALQWEMYDAFGVRPASVNDTFGGHQPEIALPPRAPLAARLARVCRAFRLGLAFWREKRSAAELLGELTRLTDDWQQRADAPAAERELVDISAEMREATLPFSMRALLLNTSVGFSLGLLARVLERRFPGRGSALANALLAGQQGITSAEHGLHLMELAELVRSDPAARAYFAAADYAPQRWEEVLPDGSPFKRRFREFLDLYGHRAVYELEIMHPRWREDPAYLLDNVRALIDTADVAATRDRQRQTAAQAWREVRARIGIPGRTVVARLVERAAADARLREAAKSAMVRISTASRAVSRQTGRRLAARGILNDADDVFHCARLELLAVFSGDWDGTGLKTLVEERKARHAALEHLPAPDLVIDERPQRAVPAPLSAAGALSGLGVAAGSASGPVRIVRHPSEGAHLAPGDVLVAPSTDPAWTPLFLRASAIVMETGGQLSHGAIVAREYGIPAVVNIPGVLQILRDGQRVTVDGDAGKVHLVEAGDHTGTASNAEHRTHKQIQKPKRLCLQEEA